MLKTVVEYVIEILLISCIISPNYTRADNVNNYESCVESENIVSEMPDINFTESSYAISSIFKYTAAFLPLAKKLAWCPESKPDGTDYTEWAVVDLQLPCIVNGLTVAGRREYSTGIIDNEKLPQVFKMQYSRDGKEWFNLNDGEEFKSSKVSTIHVLPAPIVLRFAKLLLKPSISSCIKLELHGCKAILKVKPTTATFVTTPQTTTRKLEVTHLPSNETTTTSTELSSQPTNNTRSTDKLFKEKEQNKVPIIIGVTLAVVIPVVVVLIIIYIKFSKKTQKFSISDAQMKNLLTKKT